MSKIIMILVFLLPALSINAQGDLLEAFKKSYELEAKGEYKQAAKQLKDIYDPESYEINLRLGWLNYQAGLFSESIAYYNKALDILPYSEEAKFGLINPLSASGKWDEVINVYNKILEINPKNTTANYRLGLIYYGRENYEKAYKYFENVVNLYPFGYDGLLMFAWTNLKLGKFREAKILFNKVLLYAPDDKSALEGLNKIK